MRWLVLADVAAALASLAAPAKKLEIVRTAVHQVEDGPALGADEFFVPGETVFFSCQLEGYAVSTAKRVNIRFRLEAVDPTGVPLVEPVSGKVDAELQPEDREWRPKVRQEVLIPPLAGSGSYQIRIQASDEVGGSVAAREIAFKVRGHEVAPSPTLVVRNFRFYSSEEATQPLRFVAYRPGETVWGRFDITGYKLGEGNRLHVSYSIAVLAAEGRVLFTQSEPTVEQTSSFYPQRYVPCLINLNLQPNIARGEYTIRVDVRDQVGGQTYQTQVSFRVE